MTPVLCTRLMRDGEECDVTIEFEVAYGNYIFLSAWLSDEPEVTLSAEEIDALQNWFSDHLDDAYERVRGTDYDPAFAKMNGYAHRNDALRGEV